MIIEALFPEVCGLFGDRRNIDYLQATLPDARVLQTPLSEKPFFADNTPDMIYIGSMTESTQRKVIRKLSGLQERLRELIDAGIIVLATGNAGDVFSKRILYQTEHTSIEGLGLLPNEVRTDLFHRYHGKVLGDFDGIPIVGFQCRFGFWTETEAHCPFLRVERGMGDRPGSMTEGFRDNHFFCTSLIGPLLPLNPLFTEYLLSVSGVRARAAFRPEAMKAYEQRLLEFRSRDMRF